MHKQKELFQIFGGSEIGLKAQDLAEHQDVLEGAGFAVLRGCVIAVEVFDRLLNEDCDGDIEALVKANINGEIRQINQMLLDLMIVDTPYAVRSSARSERGGTGGFI